MGSILSPLPNISELFCASFSKRGLVQTFHMKMSSICMWMKPHFHIEGYAPRLALKHRYKATRKWPISAFFSSVRLTLSIHLGGGGYRGGRPGEKGVGGNGTREKRGREAWFPRWREAGEKGKNYATLRNILQSKKFKEAGANKYRAGTGITGSGKFKPPCSPPPPLYRLDPRS